MAAKKKKKDAEARLALLHAAKLFTHIKVADLPTLPNRDLDDGLAEAIDRNPGTVHETYRALQSIPEVVKGVLVDAGLNFVQITKGSASGLYEPRTHHEWAALVNAGLAALEDRRRLIAIRGIDWEEPMFVLVTPAQAKAIAAAKIEDTYNPLELPRPTRVDARLGELATLSRRKLGTTVTVSATGAEIVLELAPDQVGVFVDKLYETRFRDQLVRHRVNRDYG